jgi:hypothetical protein
MEAGDGFVLFLGTLGGWLPELLLREGKGIMVKHMLIHGDRGFCKAEIKHLPG